MAGMDSWRGRPAEVMVLLGFISGTLSSWIGFPSTVDYLQPISAIFLLAPDPMPVGLLFATAVGLGVAVLTGRWWAFVVVLVVTLYAWSAAIHTASRIQRNSDADAYLILASLAAGAIGAGITHLGMALVAEGPRRFARLVLTVLVGAVFGLLFFAGHRKYIDERWLFALWQPAVAYCLGHALARRTHAA